MTQIANDREQSSGGLASDLASFVGFAIRRIGEKQDESLDELYLNWRRQIRQDEVAADIESAFEDLAAGRGIPMEDVFQSVRQILDGTKA